MLTEFEDRLSIIKRWAIVRSIQTQSVMEHSARVAMIARRILVEYFRNDEPAVLADVLTWSLYHDQVEAVIGDPPKMAKEYYDESRAEGDYARELLQFQPSEFVRMVVKMADYIEAIMFLDTETMMGNTAVYIHRRWLREEYEKYLNNHSLREFQEWSGEWMKEEWPTGFAVGRPKARAS